MHATTPFLHTLGSGGKRGGKGSWKEDGYSADPFDFCFHAIDAQEFHSQEVLPTSLGYHHHHHRELGCHHETSLPWRTFYRFLPKVTTTYLGGVSTCHLPGRNRPFCWELYLRQAITLPPPPACIPPWVVVWSSFLLQARTASFPIPDHSNPGFYSREGHSIPRRDDSGDSDGRTGSFHHPSIPFSDSIQAQRDDC